MRLPCHPRTGASKGQALVVFAASMVVMVGVLALAVDAGNLWVQRRSLQTIADAAALTGAQQFIAEGPNTRKPEIDATLGPRDATAYVVAHQLPCPGGTPECTVTYPVTDYGADEWQYIQVSLRRSIPLGFARVFGLREASIATSATARVMRVGYAGDAVVGLSQVAHDIFSGAPMAGFIVRGSVLSWIDITGSSADGWIRMVQGQANAGRRLVSQYLDPRGQEGYAPLRDPFKEALDAGQFSLPPHPGLFTCFDYLLPPPDALNPGQVVTPPPPPAGSGWNITIDKGRRVLLPPGRYCTLTVVGTVYFQDTRGRDPYFIQQLITRKDPPEVPQVLMDFRITNSVSPLPTDYGTLIVVLNQVAIRGTTSATAGHFELKGDPTRYDLVFYVPPNAENYVPNTAIQIDTIEPSNLVGSIYAPISDVTVMGNPDPNCLASNGQLYGARVTRGGALTKRGGRIVADRILLRIDTGSPAGTVSCGVDFPPLTKDYIFLPTLAPPRP